MTELYSDYPPRNAYYLTPKGQQLGKIISGMRDWGLEYTSPKSEIN